MHPSRTDLPHHPEAFEILLGLPITEFAVVVEEIRPAAEAERRDRLARSSRRRAPGAGRRLALSLFDSASATVLAARFADRRNVALVYRVGADTLARAYRRLHPILAVSSVSHLLAPPPVAERAERLLRALALLPHHGGLLRLLAWRCGLVIDIDDVVRPPEELTQPARPTADRVAEHDREQFPPRQGYC